MGVLKENLNVRMNLRFKSQSLKENLNVRMNLRFPLSGGREFPEYISSDRKVNREFQIERRNPTNKQTNKQSNKQSMIQYCNIYICICICIPVFVDTWEYLL